MVYNIFSVTKIYPFQGDYEIKGFITLYGSNQCIIDEIFSHADEDDCRNLSEEEYVMFDIHVQIRVVKGNIHTKRTTLIYNSWEN